MLKPKQALNFLTLMLLLNSPAQASFVNVFFNNASDLGNAFAGQAATAENAVTTFTNPAGMVRIDHPQLVGGLDVARLWARFSGTDTFILGPVVIPSTGSAGASPHIQPFPFLYYTAPAWFNCNLHFGFGVTLLGGQGGAFSRHAVIRYTIQSLSLGIVDLTPNVAYQITPQLSAGLGLDISYMKFMNSINFPSSVPGGIDFKVKGNISDVGYGWHAGLLYQIDQDTRIGLTYRSPINFKPHGEGEFIPLPNNTIRAEIVSNDLRSTFRYAAYTELAGYHRINKKWAGLASFGYNRWSAFNRVVTRNIPAFSPIAGPVGLTSNVRTGFQDTYRLALGTNFIMNECMLFRAGISYETSLTRKRYRNIPGFTKTTYLAVGAHYQRWKNVGFDAGILHAFLSNSRINTFSGVTLQNGTMKFERDTIGAQVVWDIA